MFSIVRRRAAATAATIPHRLPATFTPRSRPSYTTSAPRIASTASSGRARIGALALVGLLGGSAYLYLQEPVRADAADDADARTSRRSQPPLSTLLRSYVVYSMCSVPALVDWSPTILSTLSSVPGLKQVTEAFVRVTFFSQFVGGDTALDTVPLLEEFRAENKGTLFAYSVEVDEHEAAGKSKASGSGKAVQPVYKQVVDEMIRSIDVAADFEDKRRIGRGRTAGRRTWVAIKLTALLPDARALINLSSHLVKSRSPLAHPICFPGSPRPSDFNVLDIQDPSKLPETSPLTVEDIAALKELKDDLIKICQRAKERGVKIIVDAEYRFEFSWYQPAIDAYQLALMREFNRLPSYPSSFTRVVSAITGSSLPNGQDGGPVQPLIYGTFQAYLRRTPDYLAQAFRDAEAGNFALGVKLVRGAYHPLEVAAHREGLRETGSAEVPKSLSISPDTLPPVWLSKAETDACYNACARVLVGRVRDELRGRSVGGGERVPGVGILFGTHNWGSCEIILDELVGAGLAAREREGKGEVVRIGDEVAERVTFGQLYGMSDALTDSLVNRTRSTDPFVIKYVPYGALSEVMPYLGRRAIENKSVLGGGAAGEERKRAGTEIAKRFYSFFGRSS
ncbi:hypothetical protein M0805_008244 [Coniferiporia weirii]|nr:hypothetical protein M0805_008244 [Coniferiporia weirii]